MALYDGLPLNTPTLISQDANAEVWATRTVNGGTVEQRIKAGSDADRGQQLESRLAQGIAANSTYLTIVTPTTAQITAQVKLLTRQVQAVLRMRAGQLEAID